MQRQRYIYIYSVKVVPIAEQSKFKKEVFENNMEIFSEEIQI